MNYFERNGIVYINATPHPIRLDFEGETITLDSYCVINAKVVETLVETKNGVQFVRSNFVGDETGHQQIADIFNEFGNDTIIIGSIIAAQAYPNQVFGMTPKAGLERVAPELKIMSSTKFVAF